MLKNQKREKERALDEKKLCSWNKIQAQIIKNLLSYLKTIWLQLMDLSNEKSNNQIKYAKQFILLFIKNVKMLALCMWVGILLSE